MLILLECILFAWFAPINKIADRIRSLLPIFNKKVWIALIRFIIPLLLLVVFCGRVFKEGLTRYESYSMNVLIFGGWGVFFIVIIVAFIVGFLYNRARKNST